MESKEKSPQVVFVQKEKRKMNIPEELKELDQWVCWKKSLGPDGKLKKIPYDPKTGEFAKANIPGTWADYETAAAAANNYDGIGFEFLKGGNLFGIDLDHVIKDGVINPIAKEIIDTMDSYTELSPSGQGVHILAKGTIPDKDRRKDFIEMYSDGRYFTITGNIYNGRDKLNERTREAAAVHAKYLSRKDTNMVQEPQNNGTKNNFSSSDEEIIRKAMNSKMGARFTNLWNGNISMYGNDHSAADMALVNDLGYWTNYDPIQMDRLFRQSGLYRDKWDKKHGAETYGQMTINKALDKKAIMLKNKTATNQPVGSTTQAEIAEQLTSEKEYYIITESAAGSMDEFDSMITSTANNPGISTGFNQLDNILDGGLYPGLIIIGAVTSVGKTAICLQLMDQIAKKYDGKKPNEERTVMIFSLEMSKFELMARSISRESFLNDPDNALTVRDILDGKRLAKFSADKLSNYFESKKNYQEYAERIYIHEGLGNIKTDFIRNRIENHKLITGTPPVVLIDYIQLLAPNEPRMTDKQAVDYNVMALKQISRDYGIPVIGISSLNRASYSSRNNPNGNGSDSSTNTKVAFESFKESGAIEYSSDILIGLNRNSDDDKKCEAVMKLNILKNRNGSKDVSETFVYHYKYNCFIEQAQPQFTRTTAI